MKTFLKGLICVVVCMLLSVQAEAGKTKKVKLTGTLHEYVTMKVGLNGRVETITSLPYVFEVPKNEFPVQLTFESPNYLYYDILVPKKAFDDTGHVYILKVNESAMALNANRANLGDGEVADVKLGNQKSMIEMERERRAEMSQLLPIYYLGEDSKFMDMPISMAIDGSQMDDDSGSLMSSAISLFKKKEFIQYFNGASAELRLPRNATEFYVKVSSPSVLENLILTPLNVVKGSARELKLGKPGRIKVDYNISYSIENVAEGVYCIHIPSLASGEYAFCQHFNGKVLGVYTFGVDTYLKEFDETRLTGDDYLAFFENGVQPGEGVVTAKNHGYMADNAPVKNKQTKTSKKSRRTTSAKSKSSGESNRSKSAVPAKSDIDVNIPVGSKVLENTFALVIANENYTGVAEVPYALNDGRAVKEYLHKTFGLSEKSIIYLENATLNDMKFSINRISEICKAFNGDASLVVYYSGHGIPDESTGDGYLLPVDGYGTDPSTAMSISDLYKTLGKLPTKRVSIFMDACFSGARRDGEMLVAARGVAIKAKAEKPKGNLIAFSAAQGDETAYPHQEKRHGLMTYFLLKKIQQTKGNVTMGELFNYVKDNVKKTSIVENGKLQTPSAAVSPTLSTTWKDIKL